MPGKRARHAVSRVAATGRGAGRRTACRGTPRRPIPCRRAAATGQSSGDTSGPITAAQENVMPRLNFGAFLAPHHPIGEHPMLQFRRDLDLVEHLDRLGYDEFWCGEHHSSGWEMIASPEMFLAAAAERSKRIRLATGVVSLPYHHPFNVAQRIVQLDHMTGGRVIFGSGPGALASDAHTLGIDPMLLRDRQDEAIGVIRRLFQGERISMRSEWFTLNDAALQLLPLQEEMPFAVASQISPSGMTLAGKHGIGIISIGSLSQEGLNALPTQWGFAEAAAAKHGTSVDRRNWRVLLSWHIAETREKAREQARDGLFRHHNEYITGTLQRPGAKPFKTPDQAVEMTADSDGAVATIGTPDDLVARIKQVLEMSGGFGTVVGFVHDWANPENTMRSWDMVARYVVPEINGYLAGLRKSRAFVATNREYFERARDAVMAKITENAAAAEALKVTKSSMLSASASNVPDFEKVRAGGAR
jgi:limonene 1,2-monooxygenase